jgi:hypothetical protein
MNPTKEEAFESAITDGINIFVRTVLKSRGLLTQEDFDIVLSLEIVELKRQIAKDLASKWAKMPLRDIPE